MADLKKIADAARDYARFLCATGHRHDNRETMMFCDAMDAADAPPIVAAEPAPLPIAAEPSEPYPVPLVTPTKAG